MALPQAVAARLGSLVRYVRKVKASQTRAINSSRLRGGT